MKKEKYTLKERLTLNWIPDWIGEMIKKAGYFEIIVINGEPPFYLIKRDKNREIIERRMYKRFGWLYRHLKKKIESSPITVRPKGAQTKSLPSQKRGSKDI